MAKYSFEFKKKIVEEYLNGEGSMISLSKKYGFNEHSQLRRWIAAYRKYGAEGLMRCRNQSTYSFEKKLNIVELYLTSELSYQELALKEGIRHPALIAQWVNLYRTVGPDALRPQKKGRKKTLGRSKNNNLSNNDILNIDTSAEHVKKLEDELLKLKIENAFLKELRRLRLEDEAKMRERRSSSTASEENSN